MKWKQYRVYGMLVVMAMGAVIGWSVANGNAVVPVAAAVIGMVLIYFLKKRVTEVIKDELVYRISEKASRMTLQICLLTAALAGAVLIALRDHYPQYAHTGFTLSFSVCAALILYLLLYGYYTQHLG